jgi:hypothetical protein
MRGMMKPDEEKAFLEELKNNEELRSQAISQARLVKGMKQVDAELKDAFLQTDEDTIKRIAKDADYMNYEEQLDTIIKEAETALVDVTF